MSNQQLVCQTYLMNPAALLLLLCCAVAWYPVDAAAVSPTQKSLTGFSRRNRPPLSLTQQAEFKDKPVPLTQHVKNEDKTTKHITAGGPLTSNLESHLAEQNEGRFGFLKAGGVQLKDSVMKLGDKTSERIKGRKHWIEDSPKRRLTFNKIYNRWIEDLLTKAKDNWEKSKKAVPNLLEGLKQWAAKSKKETKHAWQKSKVLSGELKRLNDWFTNSMKKTRDTLRRSTKAIPNLVQGLKQWLKTSTKGTKDTWKKLKMFFSNDLGLFKKWFENSTMSPKPIVQRINDSPSTIKKEAKEISWKSKKAVDNVLKG